MSITQACRHIVNYTCAHESLGSALGRARFSYPARHIEADNRLGWFLGKLDAMYGDDAFYVHLRRDLNMVARSFTKRYGRGIIKAYREGILMDIPKEYEPIAIARDYCETVESNIQLFLRDKTHKMEISLENIRSDFPLFWEQIKAEGDMEAALAEFDQHHNATQTRKRRISIELVKKAVGKTKRIVNAFPDFIRYT